MKPIVMLPPFAKYGLKELFIFSSVWIAIGALLWFAHPAARPAVLLPAAGLLFTLNFFRDPRREVPSEAGLVVSPADGTVVEISECEESEFLTERKFRRVLALHEPRERLPDESAAVEAGEFF